MQSPAAAPNSGQQRPLEFAYSHQDYMTIVRILRTEAGIELGSTKSTLVYARVAKLVRRAGLQSFEQYCKLVVENKSELSAMVEALTTNTTSFFRENHHFEHFSRVALPPLVEKARAGGAVRIWSSAASSGQEPYSIALTLLAAEPSAVTLDIKILATDINSQMVERGALGVYSKEDLAGVPNHQLTRFFNPAESKSDLVASDELKRLVSFRLLNLHNEWPLRRQFDVIFCRNVMIYFDQATQEVLWKRLVDQLVPGGFLYAGHSERISGTAASEVQLAGVTTYLKSGPGRSEAPSSRSLAAKRKQH